MTYAASGETFFVPNISIMEMKSIRYAFSSKIVIHFASKGGLFSHEEVITYSIRYVKYISECIKMF